MDAVSSPARSQDSTYLTGAPVPSRGIDALLRRVGDWLMRNQHTIRTVQWAVVCVYIALLIVPAVLPLPARTAHIWSNVTLFAQFAFWGIWWPFVLLSMIVVGRMWCGLLCPEGTLSEVVSARGRGHAVPAWVKWKGWPFVAFAGTTIYGQMVSVYQYPKPAAIILGGSTVAAIVVGYLYGRSKRVWCRYLCPVNGVFGLLSKLAPVHFHVDRPAWQAWHKPRGAHATHVNCAPLVPLRTMRGGSACHMCGRCSGFRGAITLARRSPNDEIVHVAGDTAKPAETILIVFGLLGLAAGAFHWSSSALYVDVKQAMAEWLVNHGLVWLLEPLAPWWILTNYPDQNDVLSLLDGIVLIGYILASALIVGGIVIGCLTAAARILGRWSMPRLHHLAQGLIPIAACGVFLGLSSLTVTMLKAEGLALDFVDVLRALLLVGASIWSLWFGWRIAGLYTKVPALRLASMLPFGLAVAVSDASWASLFWHL
ncbi:4Fe-4S binding protein [Microbacteriaceae bacterium K1510]|nr:4Fe-4S binding protein [Microbacteriaceae bacterium K1510]